MTSKISDVKAFSVSYMGGRGCGSKPAWMGAGVSGMMVTWAGGRGEMIVTIIITFLINMMIIRWQSWDLAPFSFPFLTSSLGLIGIAGGDWIMTVMMTNNIRMVINDDD